MREKQTTMTASRGVLESYHFLPSIEKSDCCWGQTGVYLPEYAMFWGAECDSVVPGLAAWQCLPSTWHLMCSA